MRPAWSARISSLLAPRTGRLICLEFPSGKPLSEKGPPWGVTPELYEALLGHPGETVEYATAEDGSVSVVVPPATALPAGRVEVQRLALVKPTRTHQAGMDPDGSVRDFISIWSR